MRCMSARWNSKKPLKHKNLTKCLSNCNAVAIMAALYQTPARVAELVDAADSKSAAARCAGSSPAPGTRINLRIF